MYLSLVHTFLFVLPFSGLCIERDQSCITPNGENATCVSLMYCQPFIHSLLYGSNDTALEFAKQSECGFDYEPLLCCGSTGYPVASKETPTNDLLPDSSICGHHITDDRIVGGQVTNIWEFPWMALLGYRKNSTGTIGFNCGGTLINSRYVLTAAHCVRLKPEDDLVLELARLGEWRISSEEDCVDRTHECADPVVDLKIEKVISHRNYTRRSGNNDIALIRLEQNVDFTDFIRPICLPPFSADIPKAGFRLMVSGWGRTENGSSSDLKLKTEVPIVSNAECAAKIRNRGLISDNQICAGGEGGKDSCQGDSGGPLMGTHENRKDNDKMQWHLEGVTAWGVGCGLKGVPAVYTRVGNYGGWILNNMEKF